MPTRASLIVARYLARWVLSCCWAGMVFILSAWTSFHTMPVELPAGSGDIATLGMLLTDPQGFALPFEAVSVLLVAALVGGIFIARDQRKDE